MSEIIEREGKYYRKIEKEEEISDIEFLKERIRALEEKVNSMPAIPVVICPGKCPDPYPWQPYQPAWIWTTGVDYNTHDDNVHSF